MKQTSATIFCLTFIISSILSSANKNPDQASLLSFMARVSYDPYNSLANWNSSGLHVCNWTGVTCHTRRHRVIELDLSNRSLRGIISPVISNLSLLRVLDLSSNHFLGTIPEGLGSLTRLKQLSLASNRLVSQIPVTMGALRQLVYLDLGSNELVGRIPASLFCNGSSLQYVDVSNNSLDGEIPLETGCTVSDLRFLLLWSNRLVGQIPATLSNSSKLEWVDLESNSLTGKLPSEIVTRKPQLQFLYLSYNNLVSHSNNTDLGPFFASLANCTRLQELELAGNNLGGKLPSFIGNLSINLLQIHLEENLIYGSVPPIIANLSNLTLLNLSGNLLTGPIPREISLMSKLERVYLSNNSFSGEIPAGFGQLPHLGLLDLSQNAFSGLIPASLSNLTQLRRLLLHHNQLSGPIPTGLGKCSNLEILDLSHNKISGFIPNEVAGLLSLKLYLNLSSNLLHGSLPLEMSKMDMVLAIDLSTNNLSGTIPPQLESCIALESLNLSHNLLHGSIPAPIGTLPYLQVIDLSSNQLSGELPETFQQSATLNQLNLSFNDLAGKITNYGVFTSLTFSSFMGNPRLCGSVSGMKSCNRRFKTRVLKFLIAPMLVSAVLIFLLGRFKYLKHSRYRIRKQDFVGESGDEEGGQSKYPRVSYKQLVEATGGFCKSSLIGSGRFGHVYRGTLRDETRIAVKVLDLNSGENLGSFRTECRILKRTRHRNLIRIITTCSRPDFKALVLPLMANGSLDSHLYPILPSGSSSSLGSGGLRLDQLVSICSDIAEGMAYLHHHSPVRIVHCDLKPSNVLLNEEMTALVADFGIARLVTKAGRGERNAVFYSSSSSTAGLLCGSIGYIAPEYGLGRDASPEGDVYSFGILLLEIITRKRPTDIIFQAGLSLQEWVKSHYPNGLDHLIEGALLKADPLVIWSPNSDKIWRNVITELIELGLMCTQFSPSTRPTMIDVANEMGRLKQYLSQHATLTIESCSF